MTTPDDARVERRVTVIPPEDPETVRRRDRAHWNDINVDEEEVDADGTSSG